jgi:DNA-binding LacI/PurR family transcriptional regulator
MLRVPLTTVSWSRMELGRQAAELLLNPLDHDNGDAPTRRVVIPPHLVVRESCGGTPPPRKRPDQ